jgi:hypothetical protein
MVCVRDTPWRIFRHFSPKVAPPQPSGVVAVATGQ